MNEIESKAKSPLSPTMSGIVYSTLRQDILLGELPPSGKLRIDQLCKRFGVTSTPVREALNQLATEGFAQRLDQRGFFVAEASMAELTHLTNTRCSVEPLALRESIANRTVEWEEQLVLAGHRLSRTSRSVEPDSFRENPEWDKAHRAFHMALISACPSRWLVDFCALLGDHSARYRNLAMAVIYPQRNVNGEHGELMEAAIQGNVEELINKLVEHYRRTETIINTYEPMQQSSKPAGKVTPNTKKRK